MNIPRLPSVIDRPISQCPAFCIARSNVHRSAPGAESSVETKIQVSSSADLASSTRKQSGKNPFGRMSVILSRNQSWTSWRVWLKKTVGHEATGGMDPLVMEAISLVSMMTMEEDTSTVSFGLQYSSRYSSLHRKRRSRAYRAKYLIFKYEELVAA
jgi:hypothetical protein